MISRSESETKKTKSPIYILQALFLLLLMFFLTSCSNHSKGPGSTVVKQGNARFEFLTPSLVRLEYAPSGRFINAPTAVITKRDWAPVEVQTSRKNGWLTAKTSQLTLRYRLHSGRFNGKNLKVSWQDSSGNGQWRPGRNDSLNLGGLIRSYNQISSGAPPLKKIEKTKGLLSRSGYALINDSKTPVWNSKKQWIEPRQQKNNQDWYLFTYGHNYKKVLQEYAKLSGPIPMIPRYTLGPWITDMNYQYFPTAYNASKPYFKKYNEQHLKKEILRFRHNDIPLDILVMDFGWHKYGWPGGYDWSPLIPHPKQFLSWLHDHGIEVSVNDHPGYSSGNSILSNKDSHAREVLKDLGRSIPPKPTFHKDISGKWTFATDPHNRGVAQKWYLKGNGPGNWQKVKLDRSWRHQGHKNYSGIGWYKRSIQLPSNLPDSLYLYLGQVNGSFKVYVNGHSVKHSKPTGKRPLTYSNITPYVKSGQSNEIAIRVKSKHGSGGIIRGHVALKNQRPLPKIHFNLADKKQAQVFWNDLHKPLMKQGLNFWWIDGGTGSASTAGLNPQMWTNRVYYKDTKKETGKRSFIFSRYGGWGSQRYPSFFTGDADSRWPILASEVRMTARGGNVDMPYITNDIGGFRGAKIPYKLYARWVEFGTFSPLLRMHSAHENPSQGNLRMPWTYGKKGMHLAQKYFGLREQLIPYIYTYTRLAHTTSMPLLRPLYLRYSNLNEAYQHPHEYFFGRQMLVAPIIRSSDQRKIWLPPGQWINYFTGKTFKGNQTITAQYGVDDTPVFVRAGSIIPEQPQRPYTSAKPLKNVILNIYGSGSGSFNLYNDDGRSMAFKNGKYAWTQMSYTTNNGNHKIVIGPTKGSFKGQVKKREYELQVHNISKPTTVQLNGKQVRHWKWKSRTGTAVITLPDRSIQHQTTVILK